MMSNVGYVRTVLGDIPSGDLGITLSHEHLAMSPGDPIKYAASHLNNTEKIVQELSDFTSAGGKTIVEMSPLNFGRDVSAYRQIAVQANVNVICTTGFHKQDFLAGWILEMSDVDLIALLVKEICQGIDGTETKAGVIKIGTSLTQITPDEARMIQIAAAAHLETSAPINTHCDKGRMAVEQGNLLLQAGVKPDRVLLGHVDIPKDIDYLLRICDLGFNIGIDHWGRELSDHDRARIGLVRTLIDNGYIDQIFLSGDMGKKEYLKVYGGKLGLGYIPGDLRKTMISAGISRAELDHILVANPARFFTIAP